VDKVGLVYKSKLKPKCLSIKWDNNIPIVSGMAMTTEVKTGEGRVTDFFLSPLIKHGNEALTLR